MVNKRRIIYCIPGLGMDHRLFSKLQIEDVELRYLDWISPGSCKDLKEYTKVFSLQIKEDSFCILGVSLGGMLAVEIAKLRKVDHLFLISSVKNREEMPVYIKWLEKIAPKNTTKVVIETSIILKPYYDKADKRGNKLFEQMIKSADLEFINWALKAIGSWRSEEEINTSFTHIHGTEDLVFPIKNIDHAITIKGGTHYMIYNDAVKISAIISDHLKLIDREQ